jgi:UDP-N-acetylglucosamine acyltransferase
MARIHPSSCVDAAAKLADDVEIGPFCTVGPNVALGAGCRLVSHVNVAGRTTIGERTVVAPFASLGTAPQSLGYRGEPTELVIGADCDIREGVSMNVGTVEGGGVTRVGDHGFFMLNSHVAHDCQVGSHVVFANSATLGGHCEVGDHVFIGGLSAVHQHTRIGAHAMIGGVSGVRGDVIPFGLASGEHARLAGINMVGMKRRGFSRATIQAVRQTYRRLFLQSGTLEERLLSAEQEFGADAGAAAIIAFVRGRGKRTLCRPGGAADD